MLVCGLRSCHRHRVEVALRVAQNGLDVGDLSVMMHQIQHRHRHALAATHRAEGKFDRFIEVACVEGFEPLGVFSRSAQNEFFSFVARIWNFNGHIAEVPARERRFHVEQVPRGSLRDFKRVIGRWRGFEGELLVGQEVEVEGEVTTEKVGGGDQRLKWMHDGFGSWFNHRRGENP